MELLKNVYYSRITSLVLHLGFWIMTPPYNLSVIVLRLKYINCPESKITIIEESRTEIANINIVFVP